MARLNEKEKYEAATHGGGAADPHQKPLEELTRTVSTCLLWEPNFYEGGDQVAARIADLCHEVEPEAIAALAIRARHDLKLRHAPLYLARQLARIAKGKLVGDTIAAVIRRPDETAEFLALYWKGQPKRTPLAKQVKRGLALAFKKFSAYQLAKWDRPNAIKLRDVLFLVHAKPEPAIGVITVAEAIARKGYVRMATWRHGSGQGKLWADLIAGDLPPADTWEVGLSAAKNEDEKREVWVRLLKEKKLGYIALLKNVRNMLQVKVPKALIEEALIAGADRSWSLPYEFVSAARAVPAMEPALGEAMIRSLGAMPKLPGRTLLVLDVSGSMFGPIRAARPRKPGQEPDEPLNRITVAGALAALVRGVAEDATVYATAGSDRNQTHATALVPPRHGFALIDAVQARYEQLGGGGIFLAQCMQHIQAREPEPFDRVIVFTDEQDTDRKASPAHAPKLGKRNYIVNVAPYKPSLDTKAGWTRVHGWSEKVIDWIRADEGFAVQVAADTEDEQ